VFLEYFGLRALEDLPAADELRRLPVEKPQTLATVDGLATPPPEQLGLPGEMPPGEKPAPIAVDAEAAAPQASSGETPPAETPVTDAAAPDEPVADATPASPRDNPEPSATEPETEHEHTRTPEGN
jgi:hypothetical protein